MSFDMDKLNKDTTPQGIIAELGRQSNFESFAGNKQDEIFDLIDDLDSHLSKTGIDNAVMKKASLTKC